MDALAKDFDELVKFIRQFNMADAIKARHIPIANGRRTKCAACSGYRAVSYPCVLRVAADRAKGLKF